MAPAFLGLAGALIEYMCISAGFLIIAVPNNIEKPVIDYENLRRLCELKDFRAGRLINGIYYVY